MSTEATTDEDVRDAYEQARDDIEELRDRLDEVAPESQIAARTTEEEVLTYAVTELEAVLWQYAAIEDDDDI